MNAVDYAKQLIAFDSTCHRSNAEVSEHVEQSLRRLGFDTERVEYCDQQGELKVNIIGQRGSGTGGLAYFGHTDVVPAESWYRNSPGPFDPTIEGDRLIGRGSTDMKGSVACMLAAAEALADQRLRAPLVISCTADEEVDHGGADAIVDRSKIYRKFAEGGGRGIVGEPTELDVVYAHKGGCRFTLTAHGRAAHSSTGQGINANLAMIPMLKELKDIYHETSDDPSWHNGDFQPPTICWNIGVNDFNLATNITAPRSVATVGFRPMPGTNVETLLERVRSRAAALELEFHLDALHAPFHTDPESEFVDRALRISGGKARTVGYGTEASNLKGLRDLIVLGPGNIDQAHTHDEWISLEQLELGTRVYREFIRSECL